MQNTERTLLSIRQSFNSTLVRHCPLNKDEYTIYIIDIRRTPVASTRYRNKTKLDLYVWLL